MKALVTGGGGFLGGAIVKLLQQHGIQVRSLSRGRYPELEAAGVECIQGDLSQAEIATQACAACDWVFHVAAKVGMWGDYQDFYNTNVVGTENLLNAARAAGVKKFIFTSSPSVIYASGDIEGWDESAPYPTHFESNYAQTKAIAEQKVLAANAADFSTISLRPHLIWGPGHDQLVSRIIAQGKAGKIRRISDFNKLVDTCYIDDAAQAHWLAAQALQPNAACAGRAYFICQGDPRPNWDIINGILAAAGLPPAEKKVPYGMAMFIATTLEKIWKIGNLAGEPRLTRFVVHQLTTAHWFNVSAAERDFGFKAQTTIEQGMQNLAEWFARINDTQDTPSKK